MGSFCYIIFTRVKPVLRSVLHNGEIPVTANETKLGLFVGGVILSLHCVRTSESHSAVETQSSADPSPSLSLVT